MSTAFCELFKRYFSANYTITWVDMKAPAYEGAHMYAREYNGTHANEGILWKSKSAWTFE